MSNYLKDRANWLRKKCYQMFLSANQGHPGSVFSQIEILTYLFYADVINFKDIKGKKRDKLIISKGHATMGCYPILSNLGFFEEKHLLEIGKPNSLLKIFGNTSIPGIDATSGSLGHGIGVGSGYAFADKSKNDFKTFVIISEGELYEGSTWESALYASHQQLDNLVVIIDRNRKMILGDTEDCLRLEPIANKWESFGFEVTSVEGHNFTSISHGFKIINNKNGQPKLIIANTIKGKGISFMEGVPSWHYWTKLTDEQIKIANKDLGL